MFIKRNLALSLSLAFCLGTALPEAWAGKGKNDNNNNNNNNNEERIIVKPTIPLGSLQEKFQEWDSNNEPAVGSLEQITSLGLTDENFEEYIGKNRKILPVRTTQREVRHYLTSCWLRNKILSTEGEERCTYIFKRLGFYKYSHRINDVANFHGVLSQLNSIIIGNDSESFKKVACIKYVDLVLKSANATPELLGSCWSVLDDYYTGKSGVKELYKAKLILRHNCYLTEMTELEVTQFALDILSKESKSPEKEFKKAQDEIHHKKPKLTAQNNIKTMNDPLLQLEKSELLKEAELKLNQLKSTRSSSDDYEDREDMDLGDDILAQDVDPQNIEDEEINKFGKRERYEEDDDEDFPEANSNLPQLESSPANSNHQSDDSLSLENPGVVEKKAKKSVHKGTKENKSEISKALEERKLRMDRGESVQSYGQIAKSFDTTKTNLFRIEHRLGFRETTNALVEMDANRKIYNDYVTKEITHEEMINRFRKANNITLASANYLSLRFYELSKSTSKDKSDE